ncbi:MAG: RNA-binding transcriptional accessory protein [Deltaproteobacteria bacterium]|nr:RNA-binding transcriptional accessory protein [Candidatus Anaeroferrophillacea bacterium]
MIFAPNDIHARIARLIDLPAAGVAAVSRLLDEGATVPFVARYRKESSGGLDEVAIAAVRDALAAMRELDQRRAAIGKSLAERELLTPELETALAAAATLAELEDVYLPWRPRRRTRAAAARERGLEPLADYLLAGGDDVDRRAAQFIAAEGGVEDAEAALAGARDIIAEGLSEQRECREAMRRLFMERGIIRAAVRRGRETDGDTYRDYFAWEEPARTIASHRVLALRRGEREKVLSLSLRPDPAIALTQLEGVYDRHGGIPGGAAGEMVRAAMADGYARLLAPAMETETWNTLRERAEADAVRVFAENLRELLLAPPLGFCPVLALDPGFRTGAKLVCLDEQGTPRHWQTIFPLAGAERAAEAATVIRELVERYRIRALAVGNGTAGRETEAFVRGLGLPAEVDIVLVNEAGASVYSASETARQEFPALDLTIRGAISIGRRLMDPLAELVKIDPQAIGVGQYQHDVDQKLLSRALDDVVVSCVNRVGVDVNTASAELLARVAGLGPALAAALVEYRRAHGPFTDRRDFLLVPRLGPRAFEQGAGFLRIRGGKNPLDGSAIHPERYALVERMAQDAGGGTAELLADPERRRALEPQRYVGGDVGLPTLRDILAELEKPGRDPRPGFSAFRFADVHELDDLSPGMRLPGIVTNVTRFGAFVDVGVHQDGLVHISRLADRFVRDPAEVVRAGQQVEVTVLEVDRGRKRIALSMRERDGGERKHAAA